MSDKPLESILTHKVLEDVHQFWFSQVTDDDHIIVPDIEDALPWFTQSDAYDGACTAMFGSVLMHLKSFNLSGADLVQAVNPATPLHWMSLIILLDQLPRNCFRGKDAYIAYNAFDHLALYTALQSIEQKIPEHPHVRYRHAYRFWFYMPLEHSETIGMQIMVKDEHAKMFRDSGSIMNDSNQPNIDMDLEQCRTVLIKRKKQLIKFENTLRGICDDHHEAIRQFGRFPHRNDALGRVSTPGEVAYQQKKRSQPQANGV